MGPNGILPRPYLIQNEYGGVFLGYTTVEDDNTWRADQIHIDPSCQIEFVKNWMRMSQAKEWAEVSNEDLIKICSYMSSMNTTLDTEPSWVAELREAKRLVAEEIQGWIGAIMHDVQKLRSEWELKVRP